MQQLLLLQNPSFKWHYILHFDCKVVYHTYMLELLATWLVNAIVIIIAAQLLPGVHVAAFTTALLAALVLGVINAILKPILVLLTLPINLLTLGLFTFVINALLILLAAHIVTGFHVDNFWWALLFSLIVSLIHSVLNMFVKK